MEPGSTSRIISPYEEQVIDKASAYKIRKDQNTIQFFNVSGRNDHHRRPRSIGGTSDKSNLYRNAPKTKHILWHVLFGTLNVYQIADEINRNKYFGSKMIYVEQIGNLDIVLKEGQYGCKNIEKLKQVFDFMFRDGRTHKQRLDTINHLWLDPDFILVL